MRIAIICDDEFLARRIPVQDVDVLVSLGDLPDSVILEVADRCNPREILGVRGNHDLEAPFPEGVRDLHLAVHDINGVRFGGFCGSLRYKRGPYMFEQEEVERFMAEFPAVDVFCSHSPPRSIHDREAGGTHIGFAGITNFITRTQPSMVLHGHTHIAQESLVGRTRVVGTFGFRILDLPEPNGKNT